jgi:hypothetical protein
MAILALSYNMGSVTRNYNDTSITPYFENLRAKYRDGGQDIKNKITRGVLNEGIEYPERLVNEFIIKLGFLKSNIFKKEPVNL